MGMRLTAFLVLLGLSMTGCTDAGARLDGLGNAPASPVTHSCKMAQSDEALAEYIGLTEQQARERAAAAGEPVRVACIDSSYSANQETRVPQRVNLFIEDGRVVRAQRE